MDYQITVLTVSQTIPVGSATARFGPWASVSGPITFNHPQLSTMTISDDDPEFESSNYSPGETQQTLTEDTVLGYGAAEQTIPAGTKIGNFIGSYIADADGNRFALVFPREFNAPTTAPFLGGGYSVLVFPIESTDPDTGESSYPVFDPEIEYRFDGLYLISTSDDGLDYPPQSATCFARGTLIDTATGPRAIETLVPGDLIMTRDRGLQPIRWIGGTDLNATQLDLSPQLRPVRISADAIGPGRPRADLIVSPQHRVLVQSRIAHRMFGNEEVLVAAKHLVGLPGVEVIRNQPSVSYWHMLFEQHEIVLSEGAWTESLFPGAQALKSVSPAARREIYMLFPALRQTGKMPEAARPFVSGRAGRKLAQRHLSNGKNLVMTG